MMPEDIKRAIKIELEKGPANTMQMFLSWLNIMRYQESIDNFIGLSWEVSRNKILTIVSDEGLSWSFVMSYPGTLCNEDLVGFMLGYLPYLRKKVQ